MFDRWLSHPDGVSASYFFVIGAAFIFVEMGWIKTSTFLMGDATVGFSLALFTLLLSAAVGGRLSESRAMRRLPLWMGVLVGASCCIFAATRWGANWVMSHGLAGRIGLLVSGMLPIGLLMGLPFPLGMRHMARHKGDRAYGWASGGVASVLASILSAQIALDVGIASLFLVGAGAYLLTGLFWHIRRPAI